MTHQGAACYAADYSSEYYVLASLQYFISLQFLVFCAAPLSPCKGLLISCRDDDDDDDDDDNNDDTVEISDVHRQI